MVVDAFWCCFFGCFPSERSYFAHSLSLSLSLFFFCSCSKVFINNYFVFVHWHSVFVSFVLMPWTLKYTFRHPIEFELNEIYHLHPMLPSVYGGVWGQGSELISSFRDCSVSLVAPSLFDTMRICIYKYTFFSVYIFCFFSTAVYLYVCVRVWKRLAILYENDFTQ